MTNGRSGNTSQQHGTDFENLVKTAHMFPGACNAHRSGVAIHDIEGKFDPLLGLDTSIKAVGNGVIGLADAPRFYEINIHRRFVIGEWEQEDEETKIFRRLHQLIMPLGILREARGDLSPAEVLDFHMRIASFPPGALAAKAARAEAEWIKQEIAGRHGIVRFDFKIDDFKQRRLQLSVAVADMIAAVAGKPDYVGTNGSMPLHTVHDRSFCQYPLPLRLLSPRRRIDASGRDDAGCEEVGGTLFEIAPQVASKPARRTAAARRTPVRRDERTRDNGRMDLDLQRQLFGS